MYAIFAWPTPTLEPSRSCVAFTSSAFAVASAGESFALRALNAAPRMSSLLTSGGSAGGVGRALRADVTCSITFSEFQSTAAIAETCRLPTSLTSRALPRGGESCFMAVSMA